MSPFNQVGEESTSTVGEKHLPNLEQEPFLLASLRSWQASEAVSASQAELVLPVVGDANYRLGGEVE